MRLVRIVLLYLSPIFVLGLGAALLIAHENLLATFVVLAYLAFIFRIDKFKVSKDGIEVEDEHKN